MKGLEQEVVNLLQNAQAAINKTAPLAWQIAVNGTRIEGICSVSICTVCLIIASIFTYVLSKRLKVEGLHGEYLDTNIAQTLISGGVGLAACVLYIGAFKILSSNSTWMSIFNPEYVVLMKMVEGVAK